jgi:kinesin family protein 18/19
MFLLPFYKTSFNCICTGQVYNENVRDLIQPSGALHLREDGISGVRIPGLSVHRITNADDLFALMARGNKNRTQHPTDANAESSRSHSVFQLYIRTTSKLDKRMNIVKLSMIDLAGSERASATSCQGMRFTEGANINRSLLALGTLIWEHRVGPSFTFVFYISVFMGLQEVMP